MIRIVLLALAPAALASPAFAQTPDPHAGHQAPATAKPRAGAAPAAKPQAKHAAQDPHAGHGMAGQQPAAPAADPHAGHAAPKPADAQTGHGMTESPPTPMSAAELSVGTAPPPPPPTDNAADRIFGVAPMARARGIVLGEHGAVQVSKVMSDILEYKADSPAGYRWDAEAWYGGDINRLVVKTEGEGERRGLDEAEVQALYSRAVARYTDLQIGVRQDFEPRSRTYATVGFEALLPYWFEAEAALFLSDKGDLLGRLEGSYDFRLTQRLVLQPRAELEVSAQDIPRTGVGSGLTRGELDLRLRYEIRREFAPYVGVSYERRFGETADFAQAAGDDVDSTSFVVGLRAWF